MQDAIGQTINIGDIIAASSNSTFYGKGGICVVTRFGNAENLQVNGGSFVDSESVIVITKQYEHSFGTGKVFGVVQEYKDKFDYTLPEVKVSKRYVVMRIGTYKNEVPAKYYVVATVASNQQIHKDVKIVIDKFKKEFKVEYVNVDTFAITTDHHKPYTKSPAFVHGILDQSLKFIREHNLEVFINSEITSQEALEKLASYGVR